MANSVDDTKQKILQPTIYQVGAELKEQYNNLRALLAIGEQPIELAKKVSDTEFEIMATRAIKERKLFLPLTNNTQQEIEFADINKRFALLPEKTRLEIGVNNFDLNALIPKEETINKISIAINEAKKEAEPSDLFARIISFFVVAFKWLTNGFKWKEAEAEVGVSNVQDGIKEKLNALASQDIEVNNFLNRQTKNEKNQTVQENILAAVPQKVYENFGLTVPDSVKIPEPVNLITNAVMGKPMEFGKDDIILPIKNAILYPQGNDSLQTQITTKIFENSTAKKENADKGYESLSLTSPFAKTKAYAKREITNELTLKSPQEAAKFGNIAAIAIADGVSEAVYDSKFGAMNKTQAIDLIIIKVEKELEENRQNLVITREINNNTSQYLIKAAEEAKGFLDSAKHALEELPTKIGENAYAVVTLDTKGNDGVTIKDKILTDVRNNITDDVYNSLKSASNLIPKADKVRLLDITQQAGGGIKLPVSDCETCRRPNTPNAALQTSLER